MNSSQELQRIFQPLIEDLQKQLQLQKVIQSFTIHKSFTDYQPITRFLIQLQEYKQCKIIDHFEGYSFAKNEQLIVYLNKDLFHYRFANKDQYTGQMNERFQFHGKGKFKYQKNGDVYQGDWMNNMKHGKGILTAYNYEDQQYIIYQGEWREDMMNGEGKSYYYQNSQVYYQGGFLNHKMHGYGRLYDQHGNLQYQGYWQNGDKVSNNNHQNINDEDQDPDQNQDHQYCNQNGKQERKNELTRRKLQQINKIDQYPLEDEKIIDCVLVQGEIDQQDLNADKINTDMQKFE